MSAEQHTLYHHLSAKTTLYFTHSHNGISVRGENLLVPGCGRDTTETRAVKFCDIRRVVMVGRPSVSTAVLYALMKRGIPVDWLNIYGRPMGQLLSLDESLDDNLAAQNLFAQSPLALDLSRDLLMAKSDNACEVIRRRNPVHRDRQMQFRNLFQRAVSRQQLLGAEGYAANAYFANFGMLTPIPWRGRISYPAPDPVNALLSFGYGMLHNRLASALRANGLDPRRGFYHSCRGRHCALASDLMEPFRPLVDATVLKLLRKGMVKEQDFTCRKGLCCVSGDEAFRTVLHAFESMFATERPLYYRTTDIHGTVRNTWIDIRRTVNDHLDDQAAGFANLVRQGCAFPVLRLTPCAAI